MQENEFEKQVQQLMDDFRLQPSESSWLNIERRIPKSSRKRRFIAMLLLFAGIATCSFFYYTKWNSSNQALNNTSIKQGHDVRKNDAVSLDKKRNSDKSSQNNLSSPSEHEGKPGFVPGNLGLDNKENVVDENNLYDRHHKQAVTNFRSANVALYEIEPSQTVDINLHGNVPVELSKTQLPLLELPGKNEGSLTKHQQPLPPDSSLATSTDHPVKINPNKKWQWGVSAFLGRSDVIENIIGQEKSFSMDYTASVGSPFPATALNNFNSAKKIKAKTAFSFGIGIKRQLSHKSSLLTGLEFGQLNTGIETGKIKDTTANFSYNGSGPVVNLNSYYRAGTGASYTNKYYFLQIPVTYDSRLIKSKKFPVEWNAGVTITQLLGTNALVYDAYHEAFYHDSKLLNRTQLHFAAGIDMQFGINNNTYFTLGPKIQYGLSNLVKNNPYSSHFLIYGLKANIFFK